MHVIFFKGLDFMEGSVFGIALQKSLDPLSWTTIAIKGEEQIL